jgi:protein tyrosine kinase modulator
LQDMRPNGRSYGAPTNAQAGSATPGEASQDEYVLSVRDPLRVIWRRLWVVVLVAVAVAGATVWYDLQQTPTYTASAKLLVGQATDNASNLSASNLSQEAQGLVAIAKTLSSALETRPVAEAAISRLNFSMTPERLVKGLHAQQDGETQFIDVTYEDSSPERAQQVANTVGSAFSDVVSGQLSSNSGLYVMVWEGAALPDSPSSPRPKRDGALGFALGGMLGIGLVFLLERLDDRLRSPKEIEQASGIPTFGVIPR